MPEKERDWFQMAELTSNFFEVCWTWSAHLTLMKGSDVPSLSRP